MLGEVLLLAGLFAGTAAMALAYYRLSPATETLRQRLPNKISWAGVLLTVIIVLWLWSIWQTATGYGRIRSIIGMLFNLLIFETALILLFRWIRSNLVAVGISVGFTALMIWLQQSVGGNWVFNLTFILATFGATTLLIKLDYLKTRFLALVGFLWMIFDILSVLYIYPQIYRLADRPRTSFFYPAVAAGNLTLGSGDFMFLVLMTLVLLRDRGRRAACIHIALQSVALVITILVKSRDSLFPYLTVMVPIFFLVWWRSKRVQKTFYS